MTTQIQWAAGLTLRLFLKRHHPQPTEMSWVDSKEGLCEAPGLTQGRNLPTRFRFSANHPRPITKPAQIHSTSEIEELPLKKSRNFPVTREIPIILEKSIPSRPSEMSIENTQFVLSWFLSRIACSQVTVSPSLDPRIACSL